VNLPFLTLNAQLVTLILSAVIPFVVGLVTKLVAPAWLKIGTTMILSSVAAAITLSVTTTGTAVISRATILLAGEQFLGAVVAYLGIGKPNALDAKLLPRVGLGYAAPVAVAA